MSSSCSLAPDIINVWCICGVLKEIDKQNLNNSTFPSRSGGSRKSALNFIHSTDVLTAQNQHHHHHHHQPKQSIQLTEVNISTEVYVLSYVFDYNN